MVKCIDCGFCGFYVDLGDGVRWREMDKATREALVQNKEHNPPGRNLGTGHSEYLQCLKDLHEWVERRANRATISLPIILTKELVCDGYVRYRPGLAPHEHHQFYAPPTAPEPTYEYDVFLSHSSYDDELAREVQKLLQTNGINIFCTPMSIPRGKWEPQIEKALQSSRDIWVLFTESALKESVWAHHEFGYFYGFQHGKGRDELGEHCHYLYAAGTPQPGLYSHIQGTEIESFQDPTLVAKAIVEAEGKQFVVPSGYRPRQTSDREAVPSPPLKLLIRQRGSGGNSASLIGTLELGLEVSEAVFNVDAIAISEMVSITLRSQVPQIAKE